MTANFPIWDRHFKKKKIAGLNRFIARFLIFCVVFCESLFVPLNLFDLWILFTPLVSSNSYYGPKPPLLGVQMMWSWKYSTNEYVILRLSYFVSP